MDHVGAAPNLTTPLDTHVLLKASEGLANPALEEDHGLPVRTLLDGPLKALANGAVEQRRAGCAVGVAGGQGREGGEAVHVDPADREKRRSRDEGGAAAAPPRSGFHSR